MVGPIQASSGGSEDAFVTKIRSDGGAFLYSTYLGGTGTDVARGIAVDAAGNSYVTGSTFSPNFPGASTSPIDPSQSGSNDVFVTKVNAAGNALVYSTYLGGSNGDAAYAIAVDSAGNAYVVGETDSSTIAGGIPFPTVAAFQSNYRGGGDAFITKINAAGDAIVYSTYLGGSGTERAYGIAVDASGYAYVTGHTNSVGPTNGFPVLGPLQADNGSPGNYDAFVTKLHPSGSSLIYSTYLGGNGSEYSVEGGGIAIDAAGNAYIGGTTASTNFPGAGASTIQNTNIHNPLYLPPDFPAVRAVPLYSPRVACKMAVTPAESPPL